MNTPDAEAVLQQLPASLWPPLLQAVRKAADALGRKQLPVVLQPYAGFTPARLAQGRAKVGVVAALAADARLREAVGAALGADLWRDAVGGPAQELVNRFGSARAVAALVARERWAEVAEISARCSAAEEQRPAATPAPMTESGATAKVDGPALRRDLKAAVRRADAAEQRVGALQQEASALRERIASAETERAAAERRSDEERSRSRDRMGRLQRRVSEAEGRSRNDARKLAAVAAELEHLAAGLRGEHPTAPDLPGVPAQPVPAPALIPRSVRSAGRGRPCPSWRSWARWTSTRRRS